MEAAFCPKWSYSRVPDPQNLKFHRNWPFRKLKFHQNYWWGGGAPIKNPCKSLARRSISTYRRAVKNRGWLFLFYPTNLSKPLKTLIFDLFLCKFYLFLSSATGIWDLLPHLSLKMTQNTSFLGHFTGSPQLIQYSSRSKYLVETSFLAKFHQILWSEVQKSSKSQKSIWPILTFLTKNLEKHHFWPFLGPLWRLAGLKPQ